MTELKLYEVAKEIELAINEVDEDWVLTDSALQNLDKLEITLEEKAKWIAWVMTRIESYENVRGP